MRLNVKLSPDQERQLLETSMVPINEEEDHILTIQTSSAIVTPVAPVKAPAPPAILGSSGSASGAANLCPFTAEWLHIVFDKWSAMESVIQQLVVQGTTTIAPCLLSHSQASWSFQTGPALPVPKAPLWQQQLKACRCNVSRVILLDLTAISQTS